MTVLQLQKFLESCNPYAQVVVGSSDHAYRQTRPMKGEAALEGGGAHMSEWTGCKEDYSGPVDVISVVIFD